MSDIHLETNLFNTTGEDKPHSKVLWQHYQVSQHVSTRFQ